MVEVETPSAITRPEPVIDEVEATTLPETKVTGVDSEDRAAGAVTVTVFVPAVLETTVKLAWPEELVETLPGERVAPPLADRLTDWEETGLPYRSLTVTAMTEE